MKKAFFLLFQTIALFSFAQDDVKNIFFTVKPTSVTARWEYLCGRNVDYFSLQRKKDLQDNTEPTNISTIFAACNAGGYNLFSITDSMPLAGTSYYRIRLEYNDGTFVYSPFDAVQFGDLPDYLFSVSPNPISQTEKVTFKWEMYNRDLVELGVFDLTGKQIFNAPAQYYEQGEHKIEWNTSQIASGLYIVRLWVGDKIVIRKMEK